MAELKKEWDGEDEHHVCFCGPCSTKVTELKDTVGRLFAQRNALERRVASARSIFKTLRRYQAVESREGDGVHVGLAYDGSIYGPSANPRYEMFELAEAVEKWLKDKCDEALKELEGEST